MSPDPAHVLLDDHDGRPRFTCSADSPIAAAAVARCPAILDVGSPPADARCAGSVIFVGHLALGMPVTGAPESMQVVELHLVSVVVEIDDPQSRSVVARRVPIEMYRADGEPAPAAVPDLEQAAETMRVHTNARHAGRLWACAAARAGLANGDIIEARLIEVAADGATLEWLDAEGGHAVRMRFPRAATDGPQLAAALRAQLCAHRGRA
ncbi:hypothetical protein [uncultured Jatrophihabitans sp.]|uniref:hypothetical protein n=1 Tax=uncultured Jatrophihabitans sp. TaxID=1610747 RepID=UPI0035CA1739